MELSSIPCRIYGTHSGVYGLCSIRKKGEKKWEIAKEAEANKNEGDTYKLHSM